MKFTTTHLYYDKDEQGLRVKSKLQWDSNPVSLFRDEENKQIVSMLNVFWAFHVPVDSEKKIRRILKFESFRLRPFRKTLTIRLLLWSEVWTVEV